MNQNPGGTRADEATDATDATDTIGSLRDAAVRVLPIAPESFDALADQARELDRQTRAFVRAHPLATVAGAVALGFVIGRVLRG